METAAAFAGTDSQHLFSDALPRFERGRVITSYSIHYTKLYDFPWLALILYAIFGRNKFRGYVLLRSSKDITIQYVIDKCRVEGVA